jgi:general nucleoside transport system ATP-binding protein
MRVQLENIHKHYGNIRANDGIGLTVEPGTIHGVLGENGAGKSTLMKILSGFTPRTEGRILLDGAPTDYRSPAEAAARGIGMLYQDPLDFPQLTVLDNFRLGGPAHGSRDARRRLLALNRDLDFALPPGAQTGGLTVGERQQLEILRLMDMGVGVLILDEPTTGISATQKATLFAALRRMADTGKSIILVSHKLEDVEALCDRVTVLRRGRVTGEAEKPFRPDRLMEMMFGTPPEPPERRRIRPGDLLLTLDRVHAAGGRTGLVDCSVTIREGEVVGLAGLEGSGQGVFLRLAAGLTAPRQGMVRFRNLPLNGTAYPFLKSEGVHFLPGSRLEEGLVPEMDIAEHMALASDTDRFWVHWADARQTAVSRIERYNIKGDPQSPVGSLSGGNQQRLLLSFLSPNPSLLLLENPTRGLDVASAHWVWQYLQSACPAGTGIVFSSAELDEILMIADRVLVFFEGAVIKDVRAEATDLRELGLAIAGKA